MCTKYRREVIDDDISNRLKEIFLRIADSYNIVLEEWNHDIDHVHILFRGAPNTELSKFINAYKSASSRLIKKENPEIKKSLWKEMFWSQSFVKVDRFYPSSQTCHACGYINPEVKNLSVRKWTCPACGTVHDRDVNAAINIRNEGLRLLGLA